VGRFTQRWPPQRMCSNDFSDTINLAKESDLWMKPNAP
jgi:hypothetical protein